jgi:hypothetical protein
MGRWIPVVGAIVVLGSMVLAEDEAPRTFGWRGNWTGLHPSAQVPAEWPNISTGPVQGMKCATTRPASDGVSFWSVNAGDKRGKPNQVGYAHTYLHSR